MIDVYECAEDSQARYAVVFERDDETSFLYLLDLERGAGEQIIDVFNVHTVNGMPADASVTLKWTSRREAAALTVNGQLIAIFDLAHPAPRGRWAVAQDEALFVTH